MTKKLNTENKAESKPLLVAGRLTVKKLINWLNEKFTQLQINEYEVIDIHRTYFNQNDYEGGACRLVITFKNKKLSDDSPFSKGSFYCFYRIKELQWFLENGYELFLLDNSRIGILSNFELDVRKI